MKSSTRWPTSLSTKAVQTAVLKPKHLRRPRDVLYSPPPSQALKFARGADAALAGIEAKHDFAERDLIVFAAVL